MGKGASGQVGLQFWLGYNLGLIQNSCLMLFVRPKLIELLCVRGTTIEPSIEFIAVLVEHLRVELMADG